MGWESMNSVAFDGIGEEVATFKLTAGIVKADEGKVGKISTAADGTVALCADGDSFYGPLKTIDAGTNVAAVQRKGFAVLAYTGAPGLGMAKLVANGAGGVKPAPAATLATGVVANNNALTWTAKKAGADGNNISITIIDPAGNNGALSVDVVGRDINVTCATDGASAIASTAAEIKTAIDASAAADLVTVANTGASTGAALVVAVAKTDMAGGEDGRELPVVEKDTTAVTITVDLG